MILLQDRHGISKAGGEWGFFGGGIENGETPEQAVIRETKEELDYDLSDWKFFDKFHHIDVDYDVLIYVFLAPLENKMNQFTQYEGKGMKLFSIDEARKLKMFQGSFPVLDALEERYFSN